MSDASTMQSSNNKRRDPSSANRRLAIGLVVFVGCMVGMAYAAVPLYRIFCQVTGYGGTTQAADTAPAGVIDRKITVRFDANVSGGLNWNFKPINRPVTMKIGETAEIAYEVVNRGKTATSGTSTFNVTPQAAGIYFNKLECFCFTEQTVAAGEHVKMPVIFFVDPDIDNDPNLKTIDTITLSYTFFPDEKANAKAQKAAVEEIGTGRETSQPRAGARLKG
ncbi:cytochrome c oxidase assembly protein [uncultured Cohaesibacter sp.]|uniref:cytochrome c oxidase assembly protein n=1 Tax=uncultured Cohaesibacter sp. TaxID=1002546 RepID=UPI0029C676AC|nr:cytochrome c oxidase assembly protein [uncultured Cohaesibacter sp.]